MNANMNPGARIPRNAIRVWQSDETIARLSGAELTKSLRDAVMDHILRTHFEAECNLVHPKDWPSMTPRETAQMARFDTDY